MSILNSKWVKVAGWVLTVLLALLFMVSAGFKLSGSEEVGKQFAKLGLQGQERLIASGELISAVLFLIPLTHPLGVLLLSSYMGGAILAHMSHGEPYLSQSIILVLIWVTGFLRRPSLLITESVTKPPVVSIS